MKVVVSSLVSPFGIGYQCQFGELVVNATILNSTTATCITPPSTDGITNFTLLFNGSPYTAQVLPFQYFSKNHISTSFLTQISVCEDLEGDCSMCLQSPECGFCLPFSCYELSGGTVCAPIYDVAVCPGLSFKIVMN